MKIKPVGPHIINIVREWKQAEINNDTEAMFELTLMVYKNPSYNTSMHVNYPKIYQQMQECYDLEIKSMNDSSLEK